MFTRKPLIIAAALAATVGFGTVSSQAQANDPLLGALLGAGVGAAIGHGVQGRDGAVVGGAIGAIAGASIAASSSYYDNGYYGGPSTYAPAPVYYGTAPVYYQPTPVFYPRARINYVPRVVYAHSYRPHYVNHGKSHDRGQPGGRGNDGHFGH